MITADEGSGVRRVQWRRTRLGDGRVRIRATAFDRVGRRSSVRTMVRVVHR